MLKIGNANMFFPLTFCSWAYYIQSSNQHFSQETCCSCHCLNLVGSSLDLMQLLDTILYWQRVQNNYIKVTHRQHAHPLQGAGTRIYTQKTLTLEFLHTYTFYIQKFLQAKKSYTEKLWHIFLHTGAFAHRENFTHRSVYTTKHLHKEVFTHGNFSQQNIVNREEVRPYTQFLFTPKRAHTENCLHWATFAERHMYNFFYT